MLLQPLTQRTASCCCGQLRLLAVAEPLRVSVCHCLACQRRTGSSFAAQARFDAAAVTRTGTSASYVRVGDEGGRATFHFCPTCGTTVWYEAEPLPGFVMVPVGVFADPGFPPPTVSVYEERKHGWIELADGIQHLD